MQRKLNQCLEFADTIDDIMRHIHVAYIMNNYLTYINQQRNCIYISCKRTKHNIDIHVHLH